MPAPKGAGISVLIKPRPCHSEPVTDVTGVGIRNLLAGNLRKSAGIMRFRNGLPRQSADWLAMTGFFDSLNARPFSGRAFQSVKEPARSRISEAVGRDPCVPPRKGIRIPLASLCEGGGSAKRWRRERCHAFFSPSVGCADSPLPEGASQRGTAALTGRRTPRAFVPLRSTAGRRPLRPMCGCTRLSFRRGRCPHRPAGINAHSAAGPMGPAPRAPSTG